MLGQTVIIEHSEIRHMSIDRKFFANTERFDKHVTRETSMHSIFKSRLLQFEVFKLFQRLCSHEDIL